MLGKSRTGGYAAIRTPAPDAAQTAARRGRGLAQDADSAMRR